MDFFFFILGICAAIIGFFMILGTLFKVYKKFKSHPQKVKTDTVASSSSSSSSYHSPPSSSPSSSSWSAPSSSSPKWDYHIFSSFSLDVPVSFLSGCWREFRRKGFDPFTDNETERVVSIGPHLIKAIRGSRIVIVMLSRSYASSSWCLNELVDIMYCKEEMGTRVVTLFYGLDPMDVKNQTGDFGEMFNKTCGGKTKEDTEIWRRALSEVATIEGYHSSHWDNDAAMTEKIATDISNALNNTNVSSGFERLVGMEAHIEKMEKLLSLDSDEVRMVGIWGPPGIGKTTTARVLFSKHSHQFQISVFMDNIKERENFWHGDYNTKLQLPNQFLSRLLNQNYTDDEEILHLRVAQKGLKDKKVLVVFDDVDSLRQLDALGIETMWFGRGSRIIITTQKPRLLMAHGIKHLYKVNFPSEEEAFKIFCMYAFEQDHPYSDCAKVSQEVAALSGKYPLGLRLMGFYHRGMPNEDWPLSTLRTILDGEIENIINFTYDRLHGEDKELSHHHISCLRDGLTSGFLGMRQEPQPSIKNQYIKEDFSANERALGGTSNGLLHSIDIYCADTLQFSFASHLSMEFRQKGIYAFINSNETLDVIEGASASVVVFSNNFFSSTLSLDNLVKVLQCQNKTSQLVVPVFYGISPSDVVVQEYASVGRIREWSSALQELKALQAYQFREECSECDLVEEIVRDTYEKLFHTEHIGINSRLLKIEQLICKQPWGIRRIGIWGMPGIGKTTLANTFFNQASGGYEASCLIKNFDKALHEKGHHRLLEEHFGKILKGLPRIYNRITRPSFPGEKLIKKRTLVVLDDVHNPLAAESFLIGFHWFGLGSLIIITSRDKHVFRHFQINHVYEVQSLNMNEALKLFSQCAFGEDIEEQSTMKLSMEVVDYADGNPLALSFYGKELKGKKLSEMDTTFLKLKLHIPYKIHDLFKSIYEKLNDNEKNIFLDIACFFMGDDVDYVKQLLVGCGFLPHVGIDVLVEKCLVTISENRVKMHGIIQDFGKELINGETIKIERRRRLWEPWTIKFLLEDDKIGENEYPQAASKRVLGTEEIEVLSLDTSNLFFDIKPNAFENMLKLRFLKIYRYNSEILSGLCLPKGLKSLPDELRLLHWENYPLQFLPQDYNPCNLVELNMSHSHLHKLWRGTKDVGMLRKVRLCHSKQLTEIDDICKAQNIELRACPSGDLKGLLMGLLQLI